jgi:hypothetical protein
MRKNALSRPPGLCGLKKDPMRIKGIDYLLVAVVIGRCARGRGTILGGHHLVHGSTKRFMLWQRHTDQIKNNPWIYTT